MRNKSTGWPLQLRWVFFGHGGLTRLGNLPDQRNEEPDVERVAGAQGGKQASQRIVELFKQLIVKRFVRVC